MSLGRLIDAPSSSSALRASTLEWKAAMCSAVCPPPPPPSRLHQSTGTPRCAFSRRRGEGCQRDPEPCHRLAGQDCTHLCNEVSNEEGIILACGLQERLPFELLARALARSGRPAWGNQRRWPTTASPVIVHLHGLGPVTGLCVQRGWTDSGREKVPGEIIKCARWQAFWSRAPRWARRGKRSGLGPLGERMTRRGACAPETIGGLTLRHPNPIGRGRRAFRESHACWVTVLGLFRARNSIGQSVRGRRGRRPWTPQWR